jgi:hypothetical protein
VDEEGKNSETRAMTRCIRGELVARRGLEKGGPAIGDQEEEGEGEGESLRKMRKLEGGW